jgi:hypothetical protein
MTVQTCSDREALLADEDEFRQLARGGALSESESLNCAQAALLKARERISHQESCPICQRLGLAEGMRPEESDAKRGAA